MCISSNNYLEVLSSFFMLLFLLMFLDSFFIDDSDLLPKSFEELMLKEAPSLECPRTK